MIRGSRGLFYGWIIVAACFFVVAIAYGAVYSFGIFLNPLRESFGTTRAAISGAYSVTMFLYMATGLFWGWGADKYGPKITTMLGGLFIVCGFLLTSRVNAVWQLYLTYALIGIGLSPAYAPLLAMATRWFDRRRGLALGMITAGIGTGPLIMAPLVSHLVVSYGWRPAYVVIAGITALVIPGALLLKRSPQETGSPPDGETDGDNVAQPAAAAKAAATQPGGLSLKAAIGTRAFWLLAIIYLMSGVGLQMMMAHVVAYSQGKGIPPLTAATILSTISGVSIAGRVLMGIGSDWLGRKRTLALCFTIEGTMILWLIGASSPWMFFLFGALYGFGYGGHVPQIPALVGETLGLAHMGMVLGATSFFWGIGGAIGPILAGRVVDITGSYAVAFAVGGIAMLTAAGTTLLVRKPPWLAKR